jgi:hypothetical protein
VLLRNLLLVLSLCPVIRNQLLVLFSLSPVVRNLMRASVLGQRFFGYLLGWHHVLDFWSSTFPYYMEFWNDSNELMSLR